jgi:hypothetical protein
MTMTNTANVEATNVKDSILNVISRIRESANNRGRTELPTAAFSNAINAIGEHFVDCLLRTERRGSWWLDDEGRWLECSVQRIGERFPRTFTRGTSEEWNWFPATASHLADPMTGPDHVVRVTVPSLALTVNVALEQKFRFSTRNDALADSSTYLKHLLKGLNCRRPSRKDFQADLYCNGILESAKAVLCKTKKNGRLAYAGSVPHVCFVSLCIHPGKIVVSGNDGGKKIECDFVGFLPPAVNQESFASDCNAWRVVQRAKVRLWIGLDSLLQQCDTAEVESAWSTAIQGLSESVRHPKWRTESKTSATCPLETE